MVKISFQQIIDGSFQSLQVMEAEKKLQSIQMYEDALRKLEDELSDFIRRAELTKGQKTKG